MKQTLATIEVGHIHFSRTTQIEVARDRARAADVATQAGKSWGPLHGVPITIKEAWDWVGSPSTSGSDRGVAVSRWCVQLHRLVVGQPLLFPGGKWVFN